MNTSIARTLLAALALALGSSRLAAAAAPQAAAPAVLDAATPCARAAAATGIEPKNSRRTIDTTSGSNPLVTVRLVKRGADWLRTVLTSKPQNTTGAFQGRLWSRDANGIAYFSDRPAFAAASAPLPACHAADLVTLINEAGKSEYRVTETGSNGAIETDYDPTTWLATRQAIGEGAAVNYDTYQNDAGWTHAYHWREVAKNGTVTDSRIVEFSQIVSASDVEPSSERQLVEFPPGSDMVRLPATFANGHSVVRVTIGGRGFDFIVSTGSDESSIDPAVARELGLQSRPGDMHGSVRTTAPEMRIGALTIHDFNLAVMPLQLVADDHIRAVGVLGFDVLAQLEMTIDYNRREISVTKSATFTAPREDAFALPLDLSHRRADVSVRIGDTVAGNYTIATGNNTSLAVPYRLISEHPDVLMKGFPKAVGAGTLLNVTTGDRDQPAFAQIYRFGKIAIGSRLVVNDFSAYAFRNSPSDSVSGVIGTGFLQLFLVEIDYPDSLVYLIPAGATRDQLRPVKKP